MTTKGGTPHTGEFVSYLRVSTKEQEESGLGIEAQREVVDRYLNGGDWKLIKEFTEAESGKLTDRKRKELRKALELCEKTGATLIVAKMDRLTRNTAFLATLLESGARMIACDVPDLGNPSQNRFILNLMANLAELEAAKISERTTAALASKKKRGEKLGSPRPKVGALAGARSNKSEADEVALEIGPLIEELEKFGCDTLAKKAEGLTARGIKTPRSRAAKPKKQYSTWHPSSVYRIEKRYKILKEKRAEQS